MTTAVDRPLPIQRHADRHTGTSRNIRLSRRISIFLTFCTYQRHRSFIDGDKVEVVSTQIRRAAAQERFALTAYCYMPDHLHLLAEGRVATPTAGDSLPARSSSRGSTTRGRLPSGLGNGTVMNVCCARTRRRSPSRGTSSRIRAEQVLRGVCGSIRLLDRACTRSRKSWTD